MASLYIGQIESLSPEAKTVYIEFLPLKRDGKGNSYAVELKKSPAVLTNFLSKIGAKLNAKKTKIHSYAKYAKALLDNRIGEIFVDEASIQKLINKFNITTRVVEGLVEFSKKIRLEQAVKIGEITYPAGAILKFTYKG